MKRSILTPCATSPSPAPSRERGRKEVAHGVILSFLFLSLCPALAIAACHDAIRKAVTAHMLAAGLRPRGGEGAHRIVLAYARHVLTNVVTPADLTEAEGIRRDRVLAEYGDYPSSQFNADHVNAAADVAERIVNAVASELARKAKNKRS